MIDEQAGKLNEAQLERALEDLKHFHRMQDGGGLDLEKLAELPDPRPE